MDLEVLLQRGEDGRLSYFCNFRQNSQIRILPLPPSFNYKIWVLHTSLCASEYFLSMRRRGDSFRRAGRRKISNVVWWVLSGIVLLLFILILSKAGQIEPRPSIPKVNLSSFLKDLSFSFVDFSNSTTLLLFCSDVTVMTNF